MHDDIYALLQVLLPTASLACVFSQVLLAHILDDQDTGEFSMGLLGPPLRQFWHFPIHLPEEIEGKTELILEEMKFRGIKTQLFSLQDGLYLSKVSLKIN